MSTLDQQSDTEQTAVPRPRRWSRDEYHRMGQAGLFQDQRVQLIDGEVVEMVPQGSPHFTCIQLLTDALEAVFGAGCWVRQQGPLALLESSEPEPDVAVVRGRPRDYPDHPTTALLVVEVADTTLAFDRGRKAALYARAGIAEYWIVDLAAREVEVCREPVADAAAPLGHRYARRERVGAQEMLAPLAAPAARISVRDLLP